MNIINISNFKSKQYLNLKENKNIKHKPDSEILDSTSLIVEDQLSISEDYREVLKEKRTSMLEDLEEDFHLIEHFKEEMKAFNEEENPYSAELKCILISLRIINGDDVPEKDKSFLMEHKPEMYGNATLLRRTNKDPKKHKSIIDDKNEDNLEELSSQTQDLISKLSPEESTSSKDTLASDP